MKNKYLTIKTITQIGLLIFFTIALYIGSLSGPMFFDDEGFFENAVGLANFSSSFNFNLRWLSYTSLGRMAQWLGPDPYWLRLGNILIHTANAVILYFLLRRLFNLTWRQDFTSNDNHNSLSWLAFFGALLFALHPIAAYGVAYIIQRSILMATFFYLLMLLAYTEGLVRGGWHWMLAAALCYFASAYSKEHSILAPMVALALTFLINKPSVALFKKILPFFIMAMPIAVSLLLSSKGILGQAYEPNGLNMLNLSAKTQGLTGLQNAHFLSILTQANLFFKYLALWLFPNPAWMSIDMREPFATSFLSWPYALGTLAFIAYPCVAVWLLLKQGRKGLIGFALLSPWILFLTEFSAIRIQEPFVLYRSYLWMPLFFTALPFLLQKIQPKKSLILLSILSLSLLPPTLNRLKTFSSALLLWDDAEKLVQNKKNVFGIERIYYNRGTYLGMSNRYTEALADLNKTIEIIPFDLAYGNRATAYYYLGQYENALLDYNRTIVINPNNATSYYGRAIVNRLLGNIKAAEEDSKNACALGLCR